MHLAVKLGRINERDERSCWCAIDLLTQPPRRRMEENSPATELPNTWEPVGGPAGSERGTSLALALAWLGVLRQMLLSHT